MKCSKCHKRKAEWIFGIDGTGLCQECWELFCSEQWWATGGGYYEPIIDKEELIKQKVIEY